MIDKTHDQPTNTQSKATTRRINTGLGLSIGLLVTLIVAYLGWGKNFLLEDRCLDLGGAYNSTWDVCDKSMAESPKTTYTGPVFTGPIDNQSIELQLRDDFLGYRMVIGNLRIVGDLNTEKGFGKDDAALVYVLNPYLDEARQIRFLYKKNAAATELVLIGAEYQLQSVSTLRKKSTDLH